MTRDEFEQQYADRSGDALDTLHDLNLYAIPCNCGEPDCRGWQMRCLPDTLMQCVFAVEHIPDDWDGQDLLKALIADGKTELVSVLRPALAKRTDR